MTISSSIAVTYVPADCGSVIPGKSKAPQAFREVCIVQYLRDADIPTVHEYDALETPAEYSIAETSSSGVQNEQLNVSVCSDVRTSLLKSLEGDGKEESPFQLILGGECCMLPGILSAFNTHYNRLVSPHSPEKAKRVGLVYIDADTDLSTPRTSSTGTFAGMNMCHLLRTDGALESMRDFSGPGGSALCDASNTVFFGTNMQLQGNTREHFGYLFEKGFKVVPSSAVAQDAMARAREALRHLEDRVDVILVHLDVDSIDPGTFPLANVPNYTGVEFREMMAALGVFLRSEKVGGLCVAEVNPDHDRGLVMMKELTERIVGMLSARTCR